MTTGCASPRRDANCTSVSGVAIASSIQSSKRLRQSDTRACPYESLQRSSNTRGADARMTRLSADERRMPVARLLDQRETVGLPAEEVSETAQQVGIAERTLWRW
jgi:hypothetical protein